MIDSNYTEMPVAKYATAVDALTAAINNGISRPSIWLPVVKTVGITVNLAELPCWKEYRRASARHNCGAFKKRLRCLFRPSLARRYGREFVDMQARLQGEFLNAVMAARG